MSIAGERIRELRLRNRLTLDDVAKHIGVGRQAIYKYETGTVTNIPLENLEKMAVLFGSTPEYLAGWTTEPNPLEKLNVDFSKISPFEVELVLTFRSLSPRGQQLLIERSEELKLLYGKKSESNTAQSV